MFLLCTAPLHVPAVPRAPAVCETGPLRTVPQRSFFGLPFCSCPSCCSTSSLCRVAWKHEPPSSPPSASLDRSNSHPCRTDLVHLMRVFLPWSFLLHSSFPLSLLLRGSSVLSTERRSHIAHTCQTCQTVAVVIGTFTSTHQEIL